MAGSVVHVEIGAEDTDRAQRFYSGVFGWEIGPPMSPEMDYRMFQTGEEPGGAIRHRTTAATSRLPRHRRHRRALAKVGELGGTRRRQDAGAGSRLVRPLQRHEGNAFSLWQGDASAG